MVKSIQFGVWKEHPITSDCHQDLHSLRLQNTYTYTNTYIVTVSLQFWQIYHKKRHEYSDWSVHHPGNSNNVDFWQGFGALKYLVKSPTTKTESMEAKVGHFWKLSFYNWLIHLNNCYKYIKDTLCIICNVYNEIVFYFYVSIRSLFLFS